MAEIYRAKTFDGQGHSHLVAVKRVLAHLAEDDDFIQMLVDEAKIAGLLKHHNIARVYEFARAHGEYFIAMEHVDGKDLRTLLERCRQRKKAVPPQHAAYVASEIASGLHAAHIAEDSQRRPLMVVHRDVSPSNVICAYSGEVKLCDFGIAKATLSNVHTKTGVIKGKVKYMSPEQALGRKLDHRSDVFSLGSCLYEMLTRTPPFTATNEMDLLTKVRDAKYRPIGELVPGVPQELIDVTDRCLARSRSNRYQTAEEAGDAMRAFLQRYRPGYSRSHLGRYVRRMFAVEIESELRMLEEYVLSEEVSDDVGENLIGDILGPDAQFAHFTARPSGDTTLKSAIAPRRRFDPEGSTLLETESKAPNPGVLHEASTVILNTDKMPAEGRKNSVVEVDPREPMRDGSVHNANTVILPDRGNRRRRLKDN
jgi:serine/threonine-protein kinase